MSASEDERKDIARYVTRPIDSATLLTTPRARYSRGLNTNFARVPVELNVNANNTQVLEAALASGLYPKVLSMDATGGLRTLTNQQPVSFVSPAKSQLCGAFSDGQHPSSVNFKALRSEFDTSFLVYFTLMQSRKLYAWESGPVNDRALALLCGDLPEVKVMHTVLGAVLTTACGLVFPDRPSTALPNGPQSSSSSQIDTRAIRCRARAKDAPEAAF